MKVAQITKFFHPHVYGGIENVVSNLSTYLDNSEVQNTIITSSLEEEKEAEFQTQFPFRVVYVQDIPRFIRRNAQEFDLLHIHNYNRFIADKLLCWSHSKPVVITLHGGLTHIDSIKDPLNLYSKKIHDRLVSRYLINNFASAIVALTEEEKIRLLELGINDRLIKVIPNAVPDELFSLETAQSFVNRDYKYILTIARLDRVKQFEKVVETLPSLPEEIHYVVAGSGENDYLEELLKLAKTLRVSNRVHFLGRVDGVEKWNLLLGCKIFVLPSKSETQSVSIMEAMAAGKPVVASNIGSILELIPSSEYGFLFDLANYDELTASLKMLLSDEELAKKTGQAAKKRISSYKWSEIVRMYTGLYCELIESLPKHS